jgi:hypothetical protein
MHLTERQWDTIVKLIREATRVGSEAWGHLDDAITFPTLERLAEAAYMVQVDAETAHRRTVDRGGESGGMASSAGTSVADAPPTTDTSHTDREVTP